MAAANNRAQGIADGLNGFTKSADAKTAGMRNTLGKATDTLNEFNSASKYGDAFGLDAGKIADGIKGFWSKPAEKETTKESEGKAEKKESKQGESAKSAKDFIDAAKKVAEIQGNEAETVATEEKPLSRGEELRQKYGHLSAE